MLDLVTTKSGHKVNVRTYSSIPEFEAAFLSGVPDFVFLNPYHVMMARKAHGYEPFVRDADLLSGILVVRADSAIRQVSELNGKNIAFPTR